VHPIERLRWIARDRDEAPTTLAAEAAWTISDLVLEDPPAVVIACRRLVEFHPTVGPLWWVAATVLVAANPEQAARSAVDELLSDPTAEMLAAALGEPGASDGTIVIGCPAETVFDALSRRPSSVVRVAGSSPGLRAEVRKLAAVVSKSSGWDFDDADQAVDGATVVIVEARAASSRGVLISSAVAPLVRAAGDASVPLWAVAGVGRVLHDQLLGEVLRRSADRVELVEPNAIAAVIGPSGRENACSGP